jgi:hypothetical protein
LAGDTDLDVVPQISAASLKYQQTSTAVKTGSKMKSILVLFALAAFVAAVVVGQNARGAGS